MEAVRAGAGCRGYQRCFPTLSRVTITDNCRPTMPWPAWLRVAVTAEMSVLAPVTRSLMSQNTNEDGLTSLWESTEWEQFPIFTNLYRFNLIIWTSRIKRKIDTPCIYMNQSKPFKSDQSLLHIFIFACIVSWMRERERHYFRWRATSPRPPRLGGSNWA